MKDPMDNERDDIGGRDGEEGHDDDARVAAYLDDEMDAADRTGFDTRLLSDAALAAAVARERRWRAQLSQAFDPVLDESVPERLTALFHHHGPMRSATPAASSAPVAAPSATTIDLDEERRRRRGSWWAWGGMAASLAIGMLIGAKGLVPGGELERVADGGWIARGALSKALDEQVSGLPATGAGPRVGMSFQTRDGRYCRAFAVDGSGTGAGSAGLACRGDEGWRVRQLADVVAASTASTAAPGAPGAPGASGASGSSGSSGALDSFRMAASPWPKALLDDIDSLREGDALSPEAERAAAARHWRP